MVSLRSISNELPVQQENASDEMDIYDHAFNVADRADELVFNEIIEFIHQRTSGEIISIENFSVEDRLNITGHTYQLGERVTSGIYGSSYHINNEIVLDYISQNQERYQRYLPIVHSTETGLFFNANIRIVQSDNQVSRFNNLALDTSTLLTKVLSTAALIFSIYVAFLALRY